MSSSQVICISHGEDADGLISAALIKRIKDAKIILATYDNLPEIFKEIKPPVMELYICDLNLREVVIPEVLRISKFCKITYIDHHPAEEGALDRIREAGITVYHSPLDCAAVLTYDYFREELGREPGRLAAYASWGDQFEDGPIATKLLNEYDRQMVQIEGLMLCYAISRIQNEDFRKGIINELSNLAFPHRIEGVPEAAVAHMEDVSKVIEMLPEKATVYGNLAYLRMDDDTPVGTVANLITDSIGVPVGLCYREKNDELANISIRSRRGYNFHLGNITRSIAREKKGYGGGHKRASGASIPLEHVMSFIKELNKAISD